MVLNFIQRYVSLLPVALFFTVHLAFAQRTEVALFNSDNGLPQSFVNTIMQDSLGFLWIGTQGGLCRYDGYEFMVYNNKPNDSLSISNNYIKNIIEGDNGELWIATRRGLNRFFRREGKFKVYLFDNQNGEKITNNKILRVFRDKNSNIWVKTIGALHLYNPKTDDFTSYPHYNDIFNQPLETDQSPIIEDSNGNIWLGAKDGLFLFDRELMLFKHYKYDVDNSNSLWGNRVQALFEIRNGVLLIGTDKGLCEFDVAKQKFTRIPVKYFFNTGTANVGVQFIGQDVDSSLWIGTVNGLAKLLPNGSYVKFNNLYYNNQPINILNVSSVLRDRSGVLWIGSRSGLIKVNPYEQRIGGYSKDEQGNNLFSNNIVASILEDNDGNIWVGTWGSGLHKFNAKLKQNRRFSLSGPNFIADNYIHSLFKLKNGNIIAGTRNGVFMYLPQQDRFVDFFESKGIYIGDIFKNNRIYAIDEDSEGRIWFATQHGLQCLNGKSLIGFYARKGETLSLPGNEVYDVLVGKNGDIWVATIAGVARISRDIGNIYYYPFDMQTPIETLCLREAQNGLIWVGTTTGLFWINPKSENKLTSISIPSHNFSLVNDIQEDQRGRLWISTDKGIVMFNPIANLPRIFTKSDGLFTNEFNINASYQSKRGYLYFGSVIGVNVFHPDSIPINRTVPNVCLTRIQVFSKTHNIDLIPYNQQSIVIPDNFSNLTISISALDFNHPEKNLYRYQLKGHDSRWVELGTQNGITFSNLPEGIYQLNIMGANSDQVWNPDSKSFTIIVKSPWWRSRFAIWIYTFLLFLAFIVYAIRRNKNLKKINKLLAERNQVLELLSQQKEELSIKNKNITDSINYAKRIQEALLPPIDKFKELIPDSFVVFKPKDIVSGDFYWINETRNKIFVAVVDCTGHGVPGAFMSIIGVDLLRNITNVEGVDDAAEILNRLSIAVHSTFASSNIEGQEGIKIKDGMDVSFCIIDKEYNILQFAGAFSNLFLVREGKLLELKGDRYSVGMANEFGHSQFSSYYIPIQPNDMIYIFSDGIVDQFGGPEGKKFKYRRLRHLLLSSYIQPVKIQQAIIEATIDGWKGNLEQVDDILIIGFKPDLSCIF